MTEFFELLKQPNTGVIVIAIALPVFLTLAYIISRFFAGNKLYNKLKDVLEHPERVEEIIFEQHNKQYLYAHSHIIEKFLAKEGAEIVTLIKIDDVWIEKLLQKKHIKDFQRVLKYCPDKGLFTCFLVSLDHPSYAKVLLDYLTESGDMLYMRRMALSGRGEEFDGRKARGMFSENLAEIREMAGDPEWASRYFAVKVLLYDTETVSLRAVKSLFDDSHPLVRATLIKEFKTDTPEKFYKMAYDMLLHDPVVEVRNAAWYRIQKEFKELYKPSFKSLSDTEYLHVLPYFRKGNKEDESVALNLLEGDNLELRFSAAIFLESNGTLTRLINSADLGDEKTFDQTFTRLVKACEVNVTSFINVIESTNSIPTLLLASRLVLEKGEREHITTLAKKVFQLYDGSRDHRELYRTTLQCIAKRGREQDLILMKGELQKQKNQKDSCEAILGAIPEKADYIFLPVLFALLKDPSFKCNKALRHVLLHMPKDLVLPEIISIVQSKRQAYPHTIRRQALKLLGETQSHYCLQLILENLPVFPIQEAKDFAKIFSKYPKKLFAEKVDELLKSKDAKIQASIISVLPVTEDRSYISLITKALKDADPDVRVACVWALVEYKETAALHHAFSLLRDPLERIRTDVAVALGTYGTKKIIDELKKVLLDKNEVNPVKEAAIYGLGATESPEAVDVLIKTMDAFPNFKDDITSALTGKTNRKSIDKLIENFKDAHPEMKEIISTIFKHMREHGEEHLDALLREDITSLQPYIADILDKTGYIESKIRLLNHRDPAVRRGAAQTLSLLGTTSAFRGMVLASRDPDEDVRVQVIKALEKLESKDGKKILDELLNDPDKRVRKYTLWAMERLKAKTL